LLRIVPATKIDVELNMYRNQRAILLTSSKQMKALLQQKAAPNVPPTAGKANIHQNRRWSTMMLPQLLLLPIRQGLVGSKELRGRTYSCRILDQNCNDMCRLPQTIAACSCCWDRKAASLQNNAQHQLQQYLMQAARQCKAQLLTR